MQTGVELCKRTVAIRILDGEKDEAPHLVLPSLADLAGYLGR
jgi:hypothetical protein